MFNPRYLAVFACLVLSCLPSWAGSGCSISGKISDPRGGAVPGAVVTLYARDSALRFKATSDADGLYRFDRLRPAEYLIEAEAAGFARSEAQSVQLGRDSRAALDISLRLLGPRQEVVVTASGTPQPVDEVSKAITLVGEAEIDERDEFAVSEALRHVPGLRVQQLGGPGAFTSIKTRGLRNEDTAILIDGLRFRDAAAPQGDASGLLEDLIVTDLDRVEVLRGSGSSLYGSNAIGGVINLVTSEGGGRTRGVLGAEGGSLGLFRGRAQVSGGIKQDILTYSAGLAHVNVSKGVDGDDAARNTSAQGRLGFRVAPTATLSGRIYAADTFLQLNNTPQAAGNLPESGVIPAIPLPPAELRRYENGTPLSQLQTGNTTFIPSANDPDSRRTARLFSGAVTWNHQPAERVGYMLVYQGLLSNRGHPDGPAGVGFQPGSNTDSEFDGRVHTFSGQLSWQAGRIHSVNAGFEFESENFVNRLFPGQTAANSSVDVTQRSGSFFAQEQLRLADGRLQLSAAFRTQFFSLSTPELTPTASAPYQGLTFDSPPNAYTGDGSAAYFFRSTNTKLRAHAGNGYRAPSLFERFGTFFDSFGYSIFGDPRLRPDRSIAFDAGVDQSLLGSRLRISGTYFYTRLQEVIIFDFSGAIDPSTDPFGRFGGYRNTRGGLARGLELSASVTPGPSLDVTVSHTFTNADQREPVIPGILRSLGVPNHQFSLVAIQRIGPRMFVTFDLIASGDYLAPLFDPATFAGRAFQFAGIVKGDLGCSYRLPVADMKSLRFHAKVENLFDRTYYENGFRAPGAAAVAGLWLEF